METNFPKLSENIMTLFLFFLGNTFTSEQTFLYNTRNNILIEVIFLNVQNIILLLFRGTTIDKCI